jgi:hypothetical protein
MKYFMHGVDKNAIDDSLRNIKELNFDAVVASFHRETIETALKYGLELYVSSGTYSIADGFEDDRYLCKDIHGNSQIWFG